MYPNWVTCPWPDDFLKNIRLSVERSFNSLLGKDCSFYKDHGVNMICLEMHPGFAVYNPETLLKLRSAVGDVLSKL